MGECNCEANRCKEIFSKYVDSVLQKCAKIRSLMGDLEKNYGKDPTAKKLLIRIHIYIYIYNLSLGPHKVNMLLNGESDVQYPLLANDQPCS